MKKNYTLIFSIRFHLVTFAIGLGIAGTTFSAKLSAEYESQDFMGLAVDAIRREAAQGAGGIGQDALAEPKDPGYATMVPAAKAVSPPDGASDHRKARVVAARVAMLPKRQLRGWENKRPPQVTEGYISNTLAKKYDSDAWRRVTSASGASFVAGTGIDAALVAKATAAKSEGRRFVYGFLLTNADIDDEAHAEINALGVKLLGPHDNLYKVRVPASPKVLKQLQALPFVEWVGEKKVEQKLPIDLQAVVDQTTHRKHNEFAVVINVIEHDASGNFKRLLTKAGAIVGKYDRDLHDYRAVVAPELIRTLAELDFIIGIEPVREVGPGHDQSIALIGADYIRPGASETRYSGAGTRVGIIDTGFNMGDAGKAFPSHDDLAAKFGCGRNFTTSPYGVWDDSEGHGTHVLGTLAGDGTVNARFRGIAPGIGTISRIRAAKAVLSSASPAAWLEDAMDFMASTSACADYVPPPRVINISAGSRDDGSHSRNLTGTDRLSRKLDSMVWTERQLYVVCAGNDGYGPISTGTIWTPGVAKNALTVGNVYDSGYSAGKVLVGDLWNGTNSGFPTGSSRGPTGDGRMKPNVVAPGHMVTSADARLTNINGYRALTGCSQATPHVTGLAATLMEHYAELRNNPALARAVIMATAIVHDDNTSPSNNSKDNAAARSDYGLGRVSASVSHWDRLGPNGWTTRWGNSAIYEFSRWYMDINVPAAAARLMVVMTWDEKPADLNAPNAVINDLDLWVDHAPESCNDSKGQCGEWASASDVDNTEYTIINNPPPGLYRLRVVPWSIPKGPFGLPGAARVGVATTIISGDPTPAMQVSPSQSATSVRVGSTFTITPRVFCPSYVCSGIHLGMPAGPPSGVIATGLQNTLKDGVTFHNLFHDLDPIPQATFTPLNLTLGEIVQGDSRSATWTFRMLSRGPKTIRFYAWSENSGSKLFNVTVNGL